MHQCGYSAAKTAIALSTAESKTENVFDAHRGVSNKKRKATQAGLQTCLQCPLHCPKIVPVPPPPNQPLPPSQPQPGQTIQRVTLPSAYLGNVSIQVIDRGNGFYELIGGVQVGSKMMLIKVSDAQRLGFDPNVLYPLSKAQLWEPMLIQKDESLRQSTILSSLRDKANPSAAEAQQLQNALVYLSSIDAHFLTENYLQFLYQFTGLTNINDDSVNFLASVVNIPDFDNAFFMTYMAYGNGAKMFRPFATPDIVGHELSHGFCKKICALEYKGHSGALNESIADIMGFFFERWVYMKFNGDQDKTNDLRGDWDWTIGEDNAKQFRYMRNLRNPQDCPIPQPDFYRGKNWQNPNLPADNGGVHANSGVPNKLACLLMEALGFDLAGKLLVSAWKLLKPTSNFLDYRDKLKEVSVQWSCTPQVTTCLNQVGLTDDAVNDWVVI